MTLPASLIGRPVWHDLMSSDLPGSERFYTALLGWTTQAWGPPGTYTVFSAAGVALAGSMPLPPDALQRGARSHWLFYVGVPDVDTKHAEALRAGASQHVPPRDIPAVGRFSVLADPRGATFALYTPANPMAETAGMPVGHFMWYELATTDVAAGMAFYGALFGWTKGESHEGGPGGVYQTFQVGGAGRGGIFRDAQAAPSWLCYVRVADLDAAIARAASLGGKVLDGPVDVPGGARIVKIADPQGAPLALIVTP